MRKLFELNCSATRQVNKPFPDQKRGFSHLLTKACSISFQHKQRHLTWTKGPDALEGEFQSSSDVDFYIENVSINLDLSGQTLQSLVGWTGNISRRFRTWFILPIRKSNEDTGTSLFGKLWSLKRYHVFFLYYRFLPLKFSCWLLWTSFVCLARLVKLSTQIAIENSTWDLQRQWHEYILNKF